MLLFLSISLLSLVWAHGNHDHGSIGGAGGAGLLSAADVGESSEARRPAVDGAYRCVHDTLQHNSQPLSLAKRTETDETGKRQASTAKIRIRIDVSNLEAGADEHACYSTGEVVSVGGRSYTCQSADVITLEKYNWLVDQLLPEAKATLEDALYVEPLDPGIVFTDYSDQNECGFSGLEQVTISNSMMTNGVPGADLIVFVTGRPIAEDNVLAFGGECRRDSDTGRAVAGQLNFSPRSVTPGQDLWMQIGTTLHEITHVLGFSSPKFGQFRERNNDGSFTGDGNFHATEDVVTAITYPKKTGTMNVVTTPGVKSFVREHFNCSNMAGPSLEDGGSTGTAGSHWEKRDYFNEYMTGSSSVDPIFSELTLALLVDAGWYTDYDASGPGVGTLVWGRNKGCPFFEQPCNAVSGGWPSEDEHPGYFCTENGDRSCSFDLKASAKCGIINWSPQPPSENNYFSDGKGGLSSLADYCPYAYTESTDYCTDETRRASDESFGPGSRCFEATVTAFGKSAPSSYKCYQTVCVSNEHLKVEVGSGKWYDCGLVDTGLVNEETGDRIIERVREFDPSDQTGSVVCPNEEQIYAVCFNREKDDKWPIIGSITPVEGKPGGTVTIKGQGFAPTDNITVDIHGPTIDVSVNEDGTEIVCTIPDSDHFRSPTHLFSESVDVIVTNAPLEEGDTARSAIIVDGYSVNVEANAEFFAGVIDFMGDNPMYAIITGFCVLLMCLCCAYCLCSGKGDKSERKQYESDSYYF